MYDGLRNYFVECALADYESYVDFKGIKQGGLNVDIRLAMHACSSMLHLADHVLDELKPTLENRGIKSLSDYHKYLETICADFCVIRDCANAHKHRSLTKHSPCIAGAESIQEVIVITEYKDTEGLYRIAEKEVHVSLMDGRIIKLHEALEAVRQMWWDEMIALGIIQSKPRVPEIAAAVPTREQPGEAAVLNITIRRAERFKQVTKLQRFNYDKMTAEPVDLAGYQARMTIREDQRSEQG